jgi:hypothetical protein
VFGDVLRPELTHPQKAKKKYDDLIDENRQLKAALANRELDRAGSRGPEAEDF